MVTDISLPYWLDEYIFVTLKANYCSSKADMTVIDWDKSNVLNYLGTYFPRSYAESYCIFHDFFTTHLSEWGNRSSISVFDFGCGTGGEIIGLITAISEAIPAIKNVRVIALDGNHDALRLLEQIIEETSSHIPINISYKIAPIRIDDLYDLSILESILSEKFDIIMIFKAICEFVTKACFEKQNAYEHIAKSLLPKLSSCGVMLLVDVTTYNNVSREWLPQMIDDALYKLNCHVVAKNEGYNQRFTVSHSKQQNDVSKVAWRILNKGVGQPVLSNSEAIKVNSNITGLELESGFFIDYSDLDDFQRQLKQLK